MPLTPGTRLGPYEVQALLGTGGMGEVYRARDTKLNRDVAIKVLPDLFASDPERLVRFDREAQLLASLNHPHIAQVYGLEDSPPAGSGQAVTRALVMELIDGPTLADRIRDGAIPLEEVLTLARGGLIDVGSHSVTHPMLPVLPEALQQVFRVVSPLAMPPRVPRRSAMAFAVFRVKKKNGEESNTGETLY